MENHEQILKMIEEVDPNNRELMEEIDILVWEYIGFDKNSERKIDDCPDFTTSRDALKKIRPEGWGFDHDVIFNKWEVVGYVTEGYSKNYPSVESYCYLPTEELAELHCIIQAIAHERAKAIP